MALEFILPYLVVAFILKLASSPERLRVLIATRNVGLIVLVACRTKCEAVTPAAKTDLALVLYAR